MKFLAVGILFLAICGLAVAAPSYHHGGGGHGTSYAIITKHDWIPHHHGWEEKSWGSDGGWHGGVSVGHHYDGGWDKHDYDKHAKYEFDYGVKDLKTGDIKNQWEHRDGDHVKGKPLKKKRRNKIKNLNDVNFFVFYIFLYRQLFLERI